MTTARYTVTGMTCEHCVNAVKEELGALTGVSGVEVELASGQVTITSEAPISTVDVAAAVDEAGYALAAD